ncbi:MAG TPA: sigma-54-dependent Fis family transcriptional regulator [Candidatus Aminicenantes bacterium]|nr:MAG: DNA-binding response regulator [Candidatus Aminicenantes bacterium]HEK85764.1 sigma-54-dependent Fis family transcriptional regulator [Candidatus Aminicenantes bacterium]
MLKILLISSDEGTLKEVQQALALASYELFWTRPEEDFISKIQQEKPRAVIIKREGDLETIFEVLKRIKEYDPLLEVIVIGEPESPAAVAEIIRSGGLDYLSVPLQPASLTESLKKLEEKISIRRETFKLEKELANKYIFEGLVSRNARMLEIFSLIERLAKHQITVLITGETGTGKELAAKALHYLSPRKLKPFVVVDCTALPESLFESEVFGYERGAFTGADRSKPGLLKEADQGTIFFDEISEMPPSGQAKLLRFLSEGTFRPLGSTRAVRVDVRVICATNRDLKEELKLGRFREDLFHRINVAEINLPPLRKRKEDIPLLCLHFLERYNQKFGKEVRGVSNRVKKIFFDYHWPGNVRELEKIIERGVSLATENFIDVQHLPEDLIKATEQEVIDDTPYPYTYLTLAEIEKKHLVEALRAADFNKQKAAKMLGITRPALYRKLRKHRLL